MAIELFAVYSDITKLNVDVIVNAANPSLLSRGGVDGTIHRAAGPALLRECKSLGGCDTGEVKLTFGYGLLAKYVVHTVGPIWYGGDVGEDEILANCYRRCLNVATTIRANSIAFPCISAGFYGYPFKDAAKIAIDSVVNYATKTSINKIIFCCFSEEHLREYQRLIDRLPLQWIYKSSAY